MGHATDQPAPQHSPGAQPNTEPWPEGVVARYLNVVGATVDITVSSSNSERHYYRCTGCHYGRDCWATEDIAHERAQKHASECRALPRRTPGGTL